MIEAHSSDDRSHRRARRQPRAAFYRSSSRLQAIHCSLTSWSFAVRPRPNMP